jgi:hypothetical protein
MIPRLMSLDKIELGRAELLRDIHGVYGVGIAYKVRVYDEEDEERFSYAIYRPDRLNLRPKLYDAILQQTPRINLLWRRCAEGAVADNLFTALLKRAGFDRHFRTREDDQHWWSDVPAIQHENRLRYHGLKLQALAITNKLIREALTSAPPDALRLARRFPLNKRNKIYNAIAASPRMLQLADIFPLLAYAIVNADEDTNISKEAWRLVEAGARLNVIASLMEVPMAWRGLKPGAVFRGHDILHELDEPLIYATLPATTAAQRQWLRAIARSHEIGGPYIGWVARNYHQLGCTTLETVQAMLGHCLRTLPL